MKVSDAVTIGPVQVLPTGFTGFFQIKQTGQLPGSFTEVVQPSVDLRDWYFNSRTETELNLFTTTPPQTAALATGNTQARFFTPFIAVPQKEVWYFWDYTLTASKALAADIISFAPLLNPGGGGSIQLLAPVRVDAGSTRITSVAVRNQAPFWANPGDGFGVWVEDISSTGIVITARMRVTRLII